jgi:hypothetical protein
MFARSLPPLLIAAICSAIGSLAVLLIMSRPSGVAVLAGAAVPGGLGYVVSTRMRQRRRLELENMRDSALW